MLRLQLLLCTERRMTMTYLLIAAAVLAVLLLLSNILTPNEKDKKPPAGNCRNCPEFQICGGGRPRCGRRAELKK